MAGLTAFLLLSAFTLAEACQPRQAKGGFMECAMTRHKKSKSFTACLRAGLSFALCAVAGYVFLGDNQARAATDCAALDEAGLKALMNSASDALMTGQSVPVIKQSGPHNFSISDGKNNVNILGDDGAVLLKKTATEKTKNIFTIEKHGIKCNAAWTAGHVQSQYTDPKSGAVKQTNYQYKIYFLYKDQSWKIALIHYTLPNAAQAAKQS